MFSGSIIQYPFGLLVDKYPKHKINLILYGGLVAAVPMCIFGQFRTMTMYIILTLVMGVFSSISRASGIAIRTERGRIYGMGAATGAFTASLSFGQVIGPLLFFWNYRRCFWNSNCLFGWRHYWNIWYCGCCYIFQGQNKCLAKIL